MAIWYTSQDGAGNMDGTSAADAWAVATVNGTSWTTLNIAPTDTLYYLGLITTKLVINRSGTAGNPISLRGDYSGQECSVDVLQLDTACVSGMSSRTNIDFYGFTFRNATSDLISISTATPDKIRFYDCTFKDTLSTRRGLRFQCLTGGLVSGCSFINCMGTALYITTSPGVVVEDCICTDCGELGASNNTDGIAIDDGCDNAVVQRNTVTGQLGGDGSGIDIQDSVSSGTIQVLRNNCTGGEGSGISTTGNPTNLLVGNICTENKYNYFIKGSNQVNMYHCLSSNSTQNGIKAGATSPTYNSIQLTCINCIINDANSPESIFYINNSPSSALTIDNSIITTGSTYALSGSGSVSFATFTTGIDSAAGTTEADPQLYPDYQPKPASSCNRAGKAIDAFTHYGYNGRAFRKGTPTIGAFEQRFV